MTGLAAWRRLSIFLALAAAFLWFGAVAYARFSQSGVVGVNTFNTDSLNSPTSLSGTSGASINLSWTATSDTYASGHRVLRGTVAGGPYSQIAQVTPRTTTTYIDSPAPGSYYYVVRAYVQNWESGNSNQASATVTTTNTGYRSCTANAAVTTSSGDNNGFQLNPGNACANDGAYAEDTNSGTNTTLSCTDTGKDRHIFNNYGFTIPAGSAINGLEVRLDAFADSATGSPSMCVDLSWNAGTSWTATKSTTTLTTTETTYTLGTSTDTWGRSWAVGDFTDANFRLRITDVASNANRDHRLDWVAVQVTYTPP